MCAAPFLRLLESRDMVILGGKTPNISPSFYNPSTPVSYSHVMRGYTTQIHIQLFSLFASNLQSNIC